MSAVVSGLIGIEDAGNVYENNVEALVNARDAAWARLVKAVETRWREDFLGAAQVDYQREIEAAKDALRALGVGKELLRLGEP